MIKLLLINFFMGFVAVAQPTVYMIGDSTMANKKNPTENPEWGWGQALPYFLKENIKVANHAVNGRSSKSFIEEGRWESVYSQLQEGDFVFIQFGHNDQKDQDPSRYTNPSTTYRQNLIRFVEETRSKKAIPVLMTSVVRRNFNAKGVLIDTHGLYPLIVHQLANQYDVPLVDMQSLSEKIELAYGLEGSKKLHLHFEKGVNKYFPEGKEDNTHYSKLGAHEIARAAVKNLNSQGLFMEYSNPTALGLSDF
jgi:lysophospholipase L1-like esterase